MTESTSTLFVLSDSLGFYGPEGALPTSDPRIWPNLVAAELGMRCELFGRVGWTTRDGWWCVSQDPRVWAAIPGVDAVVLALGGMDSLPSPIPTALREQIRYLRPASLRARARDGYAVVQRLFAPVGWPMALPPEVTVDYLDRTHASITALRPHASTAVLGPAVHRTRAYAFAQPGWTRTDAAMRAWADDADVPYVPVRDLCEWSFDLGINNIDGIHWSFEMHEQVAQRVLRSLRAGGE
ncbi:SGNH hydrolase-type esterase domain-containing protein OS=Tsukamurella paurometabola (strain ATCC 8368 / DSM / CCUG 35730 / CIP 100753 / JCM 10117 / KCTC 9821 / NBRC 16120 / NCIMB 702349 / NCTC 13040) OX=521096 GN=Tpau_2805 PE=4 SV=1 [Tsukamurella paurometabola]|uniref:Uncharacterized protein n=1 Tax=Tsukamurella paurometabola (strain ATCC 8368 / DSM 20162 / CCUG 35730 / CIP 100753 / JCM 10117 / KCTC 9821 / NBRC 16120 / NCIMB 702349 / NCTC 13040) TaxID=521096 RepID=D5UTB8_TSUPD|nr:diglucosylglycerate octanoyltransferase [Tsukamurella paurometabola]ADG79403.1 conserved hypothetical protein [Tsukamurella paurometabola DSM 20162]SUP35579.1 Uncharacterised protein [Tsukamurella paurometabola]